MCPVWWLHMIFYYLLVFIPVWVACQKAPKLIASFDPKDVILFMDETKPIALELKNLEDFKEGNMLQICTKDNHIVQSNFSYTLTTEDISKGWSGSFSIMGNFLGELLLII